MVPPSAPPTIVFFRSPAEWRAWLERQHAAAAEIWLGFRRQACSPAGLTYPEALDEALCFGWIDGVRKRVDATSYTNRFTPRRPRSCWSDVNTRRAEELIAAGRMAPPGLAAFAARDRSRTARYSFERATATLAPAQLAIFRKNRPAWDFFSAQPPGYRKVATWWVISAKQEATRARRLAALIAKSADGHRLE